MHGFIQLINDYGYLFLFVSVYLEMLAFPLPNELLMSYVGYMVYQGKLDLSLAVFSGIAGCMFGVSTTYWIGKRLGTPFFYKYGHYVHLYPERLDKMSQMFNSYGKRLLLFTNFIPGVRHVIGYAAGISRIPYRAYAFYISIGSTLWVLAFVLLGTFLGPKYRLVTTAAKEYFSLIMIILVALLLIYSIISYQSAAIRHWTIVVYRSMFVNSQSRIRLKLLIFGAAIVLGTFLSLMFGLVDHFLDYGSLQFNQHGILLLNTFVSTQIRHILDNMALMGRPVAVLSVCGLVVLWILFRGEERKMEYQMFLFLLIGGLFFSTYLPYWVGQIARIHSRFSPDGGLILGFALYAFLVYLISRHTLHYSITILATLGGGIVILGTGLASLSLGLQLPSDLLIDWLFAGIWFSFIVLCLEFWRLVYLTERQFDQDAEWLAGQSLLKKIK